MAALTIFAYEASGLFIDEDLVVGLDIHYTIEAQHRDGIAPREDDISIRSISVSAGNAPEGVPALYWLRFAMALEVVLNSLFEVRKDIQEVLETTAREAWDRRDKDEAVTIISELVTG